MPRRRVSAPQPAPQPAGEDDTSAPDPLPHAWGLVQPPRRSRERPLTTSEALLRARLLAPLPLAGHSERTLALFAREGVTVVTAELGPYTLGLLLPRLRTLVMNSLYAMPPRIQSALVEYDEQARDERLAARMVGEQTAVTLYAGWRLGGPALARDVWPFSVAPWRELTSEQSYHWHVASWVAQELLLPTPELALGDDGLPPSERASRFLFARARHLYPSIPARALAQRCALVTHCAAQARAEGAVYWSWPEYANWLDAQPWQDLVAEGLRAALPAARRAVLAAIEERPTRPLTCAADPSLGRVS